jgi:hypothetical protein
MDDFHISSMDPDERHVSLFTPDQAGSLDEIALRLRELLAPDA